MSDHPIAKLFGERQFQVTQLLTSLASTIQKSGGLPRLEITQDDPGKQLKCCYLTTFVYTHHEHHYCRHRLV